MRLNARFRALTVPELRSCAMLPLRAASALRCASIRARASAMKRPCSAWMAVAASVSPWAASAAEREAKDAERSAAEVAAAVAGSIRLCTFCCSMLRSRETRNSSDARLVFKLPVAAGFGTAVRLGARRALPGGDYAVLAAAAAGGEMRGRHGQEEAGWC